MIVAPVATQRGWRPRLPALLTTAPGVVGLAGLILVLGVALVGPLVAPHPLDAPIGVPGSGPGHGAPFGTDYLGRDVLSRVLHGGVGVLYPAAISMFFTYLVGVGIGMVAGLSRSLVDSVLMRTVDLFLVFPPLLLLLVLIAGVGVGTGVLVVGIVLVLFPGVARIVRTATLEVSTTSYIEAAVARGERMPAIMRREILPNIMPSLLADFGVRFSGAIILGASLNFLGLGSQPPAANWALMISENREVISTNLWAVLLPALLLALLTISVNLLSDAYTHTLDRSSGVAV